METKSQDSDNLIKWTVQPPGMNQPIEVMLRPYAMEEKAPEGYARLVTIEYKAVLERAILDQIRSKAGCQGGVVQAAIFLEDLLGGSLPRRKCLRVVKDVTKATTKNEYALLLQGSYWVSEEDGAKIENMRSVKTAGKDVPHIETSIEWPEGVPETITEIDSELAHPPQANRIVSQPRDMMPSRPVPKAGGAAKPSRSASIKKLPPGGDK